MSKSKIVFFISGSIAAFKAAQAISKLVQEGCEVRCVATASALRFVGAATFEGLTGSPVLSDLWAEGHAMDHIQLSRWADAGAVCPASANTIAKLALGIADDAVSATVLAWPKEKPLHIFPAMNAQMYASEPVKENLGRLSARGWRVHESPAGTLACGEVGEGRLLEPEEIVSHLLSADGARKRVLITGGATREMIDGVRFISNVSTGRTASELCDQFAASGWSVTYAHGQQAQLPRRADKSIPFTGVEDLKSVLREELAHQSYDAIIHAAAVSDFSVNRVNGQPVSEKAKISSHDGLALDLKPTSKILPLLKEFSRNRGIRVIGFKLLVDSSTDELVDAARGLLGPEVDAVVANDWSQVAARRDRHPGLLVDKDKAIEFSTIAELVSIMKGVL